MTKVTAAKIIDAGATGRRGRGGRGAHSKYGDAVPRGAGPAGHAKWGPTSLPTPTIRFCPADSVPLHPGPLLSRSAARKTTRRGARRNNPATVWSAPFRGPAAPGKPFIISSCVRRAIAVQAMDCISCTRSGPYQLVGIATFRDQATGRFPRRSVRSLPASLATTLDVPVVRRLCRPMIGS